VTAETVLVTGAAGFVGWHVCQRLVECGYAVRGLDNFDPFYDRDRKEANIEALQRSRAFRFLSGDVREAIDVLEALDGVSVVVHLAARPGVRPSLEAQDVYFDVNARGTRVLLTACREAGVRRFVLASSSSVYGRGAALPFHEDAPLGTATSPYAASKLAAETLVTAEQKAGLRAVILRLFSVYGPRMRPDLALVRFAEQLSTGRPITLLGDGRSVRDYTYAADAARAVGLGVQWTDGDTPAAEVLNVGSGRAVALDCLVARLTAVYGVSPVIERHPAHPADLPATCADTAKARSVLGFAADVELEDGIHEFVTWYEGAHGR